ncbi:MAG: hypothetical protein JWO30_589 [Fibrobacteres bacterium]|nr:hypothetical protein [Fibrobacterota bacterium]
MKAMLFGLLATVAVLGWPRAAKAQGLLIYGGEKSDVFLGCMDCCEKDEASIWSKSGAHGYGFSKDSSIWNGFGKYGGTFGDYSPFNRWSKFPPALFDPQGNFLGYLTLNENQPQRTRVRLARIILAFWESIGRDVPGFYDIYFESDAIPMRSAEGPLSPRRPLPGAWSRDLRDSQRSWQGASPPGSRR